MEYPTIDDFIKIARANGVCEIYEKLVNGFKKYFAEEEVRISPNERTFVRRIYKRGNFTQEVILRLVPRDSTMANGLKYRVSIERFSKYFNIPDVDVIKIFPNNWMEKNYKADYAGFFKNIFEVESFLAEVQKRKR